MLRVFLRDDFRCSVLVATILSLGYLIIGLLHPPVVAYDAAVGVLEWHTLANGGPFNSILRADPADIAKDVVFPVHWYSPGQHLVPGLFTKLGLKLGTACSITSALCMFGGLLGWARLIKRIAPDRRLSARIVLLIGTLGYTASLTRVYWGGETLIFGVTPWILLASLSIPHGGPWRAIGLVSVLGTLAFFAKLTGVLVVIAAILAGFVAFVRKYRRVSAGMWGATAAVTVWAGIFYLAWMRHFGTPATSGGRHSPAQSINDTLFAFCAPWTSGFGWQDIIKLLHGGDLPHLFGQDLSGLYLLPLAVPVAVFMIKAVLASPREEWASLLAVMYLFFAVLFSVLFMRGSSISEEERHFRSIGLVVFVCSVLSAGRSRTVRGKAVLLSFYLLPVLGVVSFTHDLRQTATEQFDGFSGTHSPTTDVAALRFARNIFEREGRDALFVLARPETAVGLPIGARILSWDSVVPSPEVLRKTRYSGRVPGSVVMVMPDQMAEGEKGPILLGMFNDYPAKDWVRKNFGKTVVFVQCGSPPRSS